MRQFLCISSIVDASTSTSSYTRLVSLCTIEPLQHPFGKADLMTPAC